MLIFMTTGSFSEQVSGNNKIISGELRTAQDNDVEDVEPPRRVFRTLGVALGGLGNLDSENLAYGVYTGSSLVINPFVNGRILFEVTTDFTDALLADAELGIDIFMGEAFLAPYFGAGLGAGFARGAQENVFGLTASAALGLLLFRNSDFQPDIQAKVQVLLNQIETGYPFNYGLRLGIYF